MSLRWIVYVASKPPKGSSKTQCPKFKQKSAITSERYEIGCQLVLITNRKSHRDFLLLPILVTLYDLEWHNSPYFALFRGIWWLCRPITSQWLKIDLWCPKDTVSQLYLVKTDHTAVARDLFATVELLVIICCYIIPLVPLERVIDTILLKTCYSDLWRPDVVKSMNFKKC